MQSLVIKRGLTKRAAEEDGPSFEQQFGILANAIVADKFPQLDSMKIAFQLIEKEEDNSKACGASIYLVGKNVIYIPAFFKNNKLNTGDMMFIAQTQQFMPLSDAWLNWLKNKDLNESGELVDEELVAKNTGAKGVTIRDISDPLIKTSSMHLKCLLYTEPDMGKVPAECSLLDTAIAFGKTASESLLDSMIKNPDFLNAALAFYTPEEINGFGKKAAAFAEEVPSVELILPLDKSAKTLTEHELNALHRDGFFIRKRAAKDKSPDVIRAKQLSGMFETAKEPGKLQLLAQNGDVQEALVMCGVLLANPLRDYCCEPPLFHCNDAKTYMEQQRGPNNSKLYVVMKDKVAELPPGVMALAGNRETFKASYIDGMGDELSPDKQKVIPYDAKILMPFGGLLDIRVDELGASANKDGWANNLGTTLTITDNDKMERPIITEHSIVLPKGCRIIMPHNRNTDGTSKETSKAEFLNGDAQTPPVAYVTMNTLDAFIQEFCRKRYHKTRIYNNGSEYVISGDKSTGNMPKSIKEAALELVENYDLDPAIAKIMLKEACNGATYDRPRSSTYFITKTAEERSEWENADIPMGQVRNKEPRVERQELPTVLENPEQLQQAVTSAVQLGIKEVFDISAMKLMIRQSQFFDEIMDDIPLFMRTQDSLCRKLFQFYWHTDKMEKKYGMVKLKALEESIKCALDSLSELTIFFKLRTVDGSGVTGDTSTGLVQQTQ